MSENVIELFKRPSGKRRRPKRPPRLQALARRDARAHLCDVFGAALMKLSAPQCRELSAHIEALVGPPPA
jgi:hypothetical protein